MLDSHRLSQGGGITELWYDSNTYSETNVLAAWDTIMTRFGSKWNVFAIDLKNEPHGSASWGWNSQSTDWNLAAQRFISVRFAVFSRASCVVEAILSTMYSNLCK